MVHADVSRILPAYKSQSQLSLSTVLIEEIVNKTPTAIEAILVAFLL